MDAPISVFIIAAVIFLVIVGLLWRYWQSVAEVSASDESFSRRVARLNERQSNRIDDDHLRNITDDDEAVLRVHEAFDLLKTAQRAAARYPGHKALVEALVRTVPQLVLRFGPGILRELELRAASKDPDIRAIVEKVIGGTHIRSRFPEDHAAISKVLGTMAPKARDPGKELRPTRKRGRR